MRSAICGRGSWRSFARRCGAAICALRRRLHQQLLEINQAVFFDTNPIPIKYMMKRLGLLPANEHRLPMVPATAELERRLDGVLERAGLLKGDAA